MQYYFIGPNGTSPRYDSRQYCVEMMELSIATNGSLRSAYTIRRDPARRASTITHNGTTYRLHKKYFWRIRWTTSARHVHYADFTSGERATEEAEYLAQFSNVSGVGIEKITFEFRKDRKADSPDPIPINEDIEWSEDQVDLVRFSFLE